MSKIKIGKNLLKEMPPMNEPAATILPRMKTSLGEFAYLGGIWRFGGSIRF